MSQGILPSELLTPTGTIQEKHSLVVTREQCFQCWFTKCCLHCRLLKPGRQHKARQTSCPDPSWANAEKPHLFCKQMSLTAMAPNTCSPSTAGEQAFPQRTLWWKWRAEGQPGLWLLLALCREGVRSHWSFRGSCGQQQGQSRAFQWCITCS